MINQKYGHLFPDYNLNHSLIADFSFYIMEGSLVHTDLKQDSLPYIFYFKGANSFNILVLKEIQRGKIIKFYLKEIPVQWKGK